MLLMVYVKQHVKWLVNMNINSIKYITWIQACYCVMYDFFFTLSVEILLHDFFKSHTLNAANIVTVNPY